MWYAKANKQTNKKSQVYQLFKDVTLVHVDGDQSLVLDPVKFGQVVGGLLDEHSEEVQEFLFGEDHHLLAEFGIFKGLL